MRQPHEVCYYILNSNTLDLFPNTVPFFFSNFLNLKNLMMRRALYSLVLLKSFVFLGNGQLLNSYCLPFGAPGSQRPDSKFSRVTKALTVAHLCCLVMTFFHCTLKLLREPGRREAPLHQRRAPLGSASGSSQPCTGRRRSGLGWSPSPARARRRRERC